MKSLLHIWLFAILAICNLATAQTGTSEDSSQQVAPTTKERIATLKTQQAEAIQTLLTAINLIPSDPTKVTSKETFDALDKGYADMNRTKSAAGSILVAIRLETLAIAKDSAFSDDQKAELKTSAKALKEECDAVTAEADAVLKNIAKAPKVLREAKKVYKSYLNLQGDAEANATLKTAIDTYAASLTIPPATVTTAPAAPAPEPAKLEGPTPEKTLEEPETAPAD